MSLRLLGCVLLLIVLAAFKFPASGPSQQPPENPNVITRWEYKVLNADANHCASESDLNGLGREGWELVGFERAPTPFPHESTGSMLIRAAATGPNAQVQPQTADSFEGAIEMKMAAVQPGQCHVVLKRHWRPPAKP